MASNLPHRVFADRLQSTTVVAEINAVCDEICQHYGFDHYYYIAQIPTSFIKPRTVYLHGSPADWWDRYEKKQYIKHDPLIRHCAHNNLPAEWHMLSDAAEKDPIVAKLMREAHNYGLRNGLSIPVHSRAGDSAVWTYVMNREDSKVAAHIQKVTPEIYLLSAHAHEAVMRLEGSHHLADQPTLTTREKECLVWAAEGETTWDIAGRLRVCESTVIFHLQNVMKKLGASNRQQAIAKAVVQGLIRPDYR